MKYLVADVETYGTDPNNGKLLGVAVSDLSGNSEYYLLQYYDYATSKWIVEDDYEYVLSHLRSQFMDCELIGHNYSYDKLWLDYYLTLDTKWHADTRLMWHMSSAPSGPRPYGLKDAQVEVLKWDRKGNEEINDQIKARKGTPGSDIYLADKEVIRLYALKDAKSTAALYNVLKVFFDQYDCWDLLGKMMQYSWMLQECTNNGIKVDVSKLESYIEELNLTKIRSKELFLEHGKVYIDRLERMWREDRAVKYLSASAKERFLNNYDMQKKFNLSSDKDKRELFYHIMKLPILIETENGKPSSSMEAIKLSTRDKPELAELVKFYEDYEKAETLLNSFAKPWLGALYNNRLHPRFNPCGTVSYRLSGFKPYLLNAPFDEKELMSCLTCDDGWEGLHADFTSIEPAVTAHYSQDTNLLRVFRDGQGDVYLDLAKTLFPNDQELQKGYNSCLPVTSEIKEKFKDQRKIAKIIQLAVQYTGTKYTVKKNLDNAGFPVSLQEADNLVNAYWKHFHKVEQMNENLFNLYAKQGYLRNAIGRVIRVPSSVRIQKKDGTYWDKPLERYKDLPNRFIQSSAHDILSLWVLKINELVKERGITAKSVIVDCHDSTTWQCPKDGIERLENVFIDALTWLNNEVKMSVKVKIEMKRFLTLAGLKGKE